MALVQKEINDTQHSHRGHNATIWSFPIRNSTLVHSHYHLIDSTRHHA